MSAEAEPRRSVRATKGQHTKSFDELEPAAPKKRQTKKSKKAQQQDEEPDAEEVIRCVCGATEQDEDSGEAWISCETCFVWQHNVCVGVSSFEDEIPDNYWCERCRPQDHKELLAGIEKGEKPWEARRKAHEEAEAEKKKKKGGRKPKGKRASESKDDKPSPAPDGGAKEKKESTPVPRQGKRKSREDSHDTDGKSAKQRRTSELDPSPAAPPKALYTPPKDLAATITDLPGTRVGPAKALKKSVGHVLSGMAGDNEYTAPKGETTDSMAERYALQIERAVFDTHPASKGQKEYSQQIKSLAFNLKNNPEICQGLVHGQHSPNTLAVMSSEQLASAEMQRQDAEMRAKAEKASILYTSETGPRVRRTHKGEEVVEDEAMPASDVPLPLPGGGSRRGAADKDKPIKRESTDHGDAASVRSPSQGEGHQRSPSQSNFDITKVFSSVKSPPLGQARRPSGPALQTSGPGFDPDVDRMLEEDNESEPYSPTEDAHDPDVVWKGSLAMSSIADFKARAKHAGGANFSVIGPWSKLIPKRMTVAGRISQQSATEYLCSLRYSDLTDVVVVSLTPESEGSQEEFKALIDYFITKKRYGVVGDKTVGNVRDTYLIPVPAGEDNHPEFMLNLVDNYIPRSRTEPMLLAVFVYRNDPDQLTKFRKDSATSSSAAAPGATGSPVQPSMATETPTPTPSGYGQRSNSMSGPAFSPATPQGSFSPRPPQQQYNGPGGHPPMQSTTPVPIPQPPYTRPAAATANAPAQTIPPQQPSIPAQQQHPPAAPHAAPAAAAAVAAPPTNQAAEQQKFQLQKQGQALAEEVLGPMIKVPTVQFLLPQAFQMSRREWEVIRGIYEQDARARDDLQYLGALLEKRGAETRKESGGGGGAGTGAGAAAGQDAAAASKAAA